MDIRRHFGVTPANSAKPQIIPAAPVVKSKSSQIDESGKKPLKTTKGSSKPSESPKHKPRPKKHSNPEDDSGADSEDPIPRKYREKNKKQKTKSPAKQKSDADSAEEFEDMPKRKSKQSEEAARRTSPRKPKLQLVGEETEKEHRSPPPATKKPAEKPKIIRPPPTKVSNVAKKRKTQRVSLVESDSDVESIEPEEPEIARKQPTRASPRKAANNHTRPRSNEKQPEEDVNDSNESLVQLKDPKDKRRSKGDDPSISSFIQKTDPAETSKKTTNEAVKGKGKPNLPIVSPSDFFGTKGNKPTAVTTSKPLAKEKIMEPENDADFEELLAVSNKLETPAVVKSKVAVERVKKDSKNLDESSAGSTMEKTIESKKSPEKKQKLESLSKKPEPKVASVPVTLVKPIVNEKLLAPSTSTTTKSTPSLSQSSEKSDSSQSSVLCHMWVDKYKPKTLKQVVGQQGDKSPANKLLLWLKNWAKLHLGSNSETKSKSKFDDGSTCKAVLLSGPPGIGKTTTAVLACQELGLSFVEFNASDARNKKIMDNQLADSLESQSMDQFTTKKQKSDCSGIRHVLIMDEVDGMSGNEDRGGLQELIQLIKRSKVPLICICNDRQDAKMRTLSNYCYDLRFSRPRTEQIRSAIMSVAFKEGLKISAPAVDQIIEGSNHDIRQILNLLSVWSSTDKNINVESATSDSKNAKKDIVVNPFEITRLVFSDSKEGPKLGIVEKSDLFFHDYNVMPLFIQENYINAVPHAAKTNLERLTLMSEVADCLAMSDTVERMIRNTNNWTLLPNQVENRIDILKFLDQHHIRFVEAMLTTVIPGEVLKGHMQGMINFPTWFGKNSKQNKIKRLVNQLHNHMSLHVSADLHSFSQLYLPTFRNCFTYPLLHDEGNGVQQVFKAAHSYCLLRQDLDDIHEITQWPDMLDPMSKVPSKTKAALTRLFTKEGSKLPYATVANAAGKKRRAAVSDVDDEIQLDEDGNPIQKESALDEETEETEGGETIEDDGMIKKKEISKTSGKATTSKAKPAASKRKRT